MKVQTPASLAIPADLVDAVRAFPVARAVEHCGQAFSISPFDMYASCPRCGVRWKVRGFSASAEVEDVFDAFFQWMSQPGADRVVTERQKQLEADE